MLCSACELLKELKENTTSCELLNSLLHLIVYFQNCSTSIQQISTKRKDDQKVMLLYLYKDRIRNVKNKTTNANACSVCECLLHLLADVVLEDDGHDGDEGERGEQRN